MVDNGFAEVAADEADKGKEWYIPHFGIYHPKKRKLRVVFDASARYANESLNEKLLTGPDHMYSLVGILLWFCKNPIAISCDVEKMFHNFYVPEAHRDYLRYLWIYSDLKSVSTYIMKKHLFGATSSPGVATFALRHIARQHEHEKPSASRFIIKDFYVDDGITSVNTTEEAVNLIAEATDICNSGNLRLHKFVSNSREVMAAIPLSKVVQEAQGLNLFHDRLPTERTLGIEWSIQTDTIEFKNNMKFTAPTRRGLLSAVSQLYDPLGLLSPFTLKGKMISQKACQEKGEWDAEVSMQLQEQWQEWVNELDNLDTVKIDRCVQAKDLGRAVHTELHHFRDASLQGYGACTYLRMVDEHSKVHVTLLMAKGRVAPTKLMTIPRLELQAAVEAAKLSATLKAELDMKIDEEYFWSDSAVALGYIKNSEHRYHMFVANRVQTIRSNSECEQWHHVPGKANPADLVSRGASLFSLQKSSWWDGPQFLHAPDIRKHLNNEYSGETLPEDQEIKRPKQALCARKAQPEERKLNFERHGSWTKLIRAIATAKTMLKNRSWRKQNLDVFQLQEAEKIVIKPMQREYYRDELKALESSQSVHNQSSLLCLTPSLDKQGMMRIGGRARRSLALSFEEKHLLILPEKAHVSKLLIERAHQKVYHQEQALTLGALRTQGYWITAANKLVKRHIHQCAPCRAMRAPAVQQQMEELPQSRIEPTPPFTHIHVGMDCFGPYTVKDRRIEVKRWGLLLTCMYSRLST
ncbi:uncharacterized protein [Watersipora subatra]|uniref:uncharacterized protein n=1 Tax=Watersipora subatra TaxID=2589382 RepID=UPI00355BBF3F